MTVTVATLLVIIALVLAAFDEFNAQGRSLTGWAVILIAVAWLYGDVTG